MAYNIDTRYGYRNNKRIYLRTICSDNIIYCVKLPRHNVVQSKTERSEKTYLTRVETISR